MGNYIYNCGRQTLRMFNPYMYYDTVNHQFVNKDFHDMINVDKKNYLIC